MSTNLILPLYSLYFLYCCQCGQQGKDPHMGYIKHVSSPRREFRTLEIENASRVPTLGWCQKNLRAVWHFHPRAIATFLNIIGCGPWKQSHHGISNRVIF